MLTKIRKYTIDAMKKGLVVKVRPVSAGGRLSSRGQVAFILILLAALGLIFYVVTLHYSKVTTSKDRTMIAAQQASSVMASFMASYAQQISEENIKGGLKYCQKTSFFKAFVKAVALIVLAIICTFVPGLQGLAPAMWAAAAMAVAGAAIDALVIQPTITDMWNKAMQNLSTEGKVIELGVQWGLRMAVDDIVEFPDLLDWDFDGVFGWVNEAEPWRLANDSIARFPFYYTERLKQIRMPDGDGITEVGVQLSDFIFLRDTVFDADGNPVTVDLWGLHDPVDNPPPVHPCHNPATAPSECARGCFPVRDPCCDIKGCGDFFDDDGNIVAVTCGENWTDPNPIPPGWVPTDWDCCFSCSEPPGGVPENDTCDYYPVGDGVCTATGYIPGYPFVLDPFYEDTKNTDYSFRENIGRDDESPFYMVHPLGPDWHSDVMHTQIVRAPAPNPSNPHEAYRVEDASGFWQGDSQTVAEGHPGIYPFLYAMQDIGVDLDTTSGRNQCFWVHQNIPGSCVMYPYDQTNKNPNIPIFSPLTLGSIDTRSGDGTVRDLGAGGRPDQVPAPAIFLQDNQCGRDDAGEPRMGWKRGIDKFCSTVYPYNMECAKHSVCLDLATGDEGDETDEERDCFCEERPISERPLFPEDFLDELYYGLPEFLDWAASFSAAALSGDAPFLQKTIRRWYEEEAADWIEPACADPTCVPYCGNPQCQLCEGPQNNGVCDPANPQVIMNACCPGSFTKAARPGVLHVWRDQLQWMYGRLNDWLTASYAGGTICQGSNAVWCVPQNDCGAPPGEAMTFDSNNNLVRGDLEDVVACLDWNANDRLTFDDLKNSLTISATGNSEKFDACDTNCGPWACSELPRSLVVPAMMFQSSDREEFLECDWAVNGPGATVGACLEKCSSSTFELSYGMGSFDARYCDYEVLGDPTTLTVDEILAADQFFADVLSHKDTANDTNGSCEDPAFRQFVQESADAAENQVLKLRQRHKFLNYIWQEAVRVRDIFGEAVDRFSEFLDNNTPFNIGPNLNTATLGAGYIDPDRPRIVDWSSPLYAQHSVDSPAELLIRLRQAVDEPGFDTGDTSSVAVYVWRGPEWESPRISMNGTPTTEGTVHAVKVEVRAPLRCNNRCSLDGTRRQRWPWLKTKTKRWGTVRCYYLREYRGRVKARVIRWDEPVNHGSRFFRFANNVPIFGMGTEHPDRAGQSSPGGIFTRGAGGAGASPCYLQIHEFFRGVGEYIADSGAGAPQHLHHAFMLNDVPHFPERTTSPGQEYDQCWAYVHDNMLVHGIHSESCAVYFWDHSVGDMGVRFVTCDDRFLDGSL